MTGAHAFAREHAPVDEEFASAFYSGGYGSIRFGSGAGKYRG